MTKNDLTLRTQVERPLEFQEGDDNVNRLMYWSGVWAPGTYEPNEVVRRGNAWVCLNTTTDPPSEASADWEELSYSVIELFSGAQLLDITGTTPVVFSYDPVNANPSELFDVVGGNLQAKLDVVVSLNVAIVWTPTIANNQDAGIVVDLVLRSATGGSTLPVDDPYGNIFQSSRANSVAFGASHQLGYADMKTGDTLGVDVSDYTGQLGVTDLDRLRLYVEFLGVVS